LIHLARVLVLSPHPDDEAIGCGGTLCRHSAAGDEIRVIFLTSGERGSRVMSLGETASVREKEAQAAALVLGIAGMEFLRGPDGRLRSSTALVGKIVEAIEGFRPDYLYTTHGGEAHSDHRAAFRTAMSAVANAPRPWPAVRLFEVWTPLKEPTHLEDITPHVAAKTRAVRCYASQCDNVRFDEACIALNRYRGLMHGESNYAEAFVETVLPRPRAHTSS
jgi:N-acetylglucosamine malate deacetylase 1